MVYTWALKGFPYPEFGVYVRSIDRYLDPWGKVRLGNALLYTVLFTRVEYMAHI